MTVQEERCKGNSSTRRVKYNRTGMAMFDELPRALEAARLRVGLKTQKEAAERCGVTQAQLSAWETGRKVPSLKTLGRLLDAYGLSLADFEVILDEESKRPNLLSELIATNRELIERVRAIEARGDLEMKEDAAAVAAEPRPRG